MTGAEIAALIAGFALVLTAPLLWRPHVLAGAAFTAMLFSGSLASVLKTNVIGYSDEALVVLLAVVAAASRRGRRQAFARVPGTGWVAGFLAVGILSAIVVGVSAPVILGTLVLLFKPWLFAWGIAQLEWTDRHIRNATQFGAWILVLAIAGSVANLALGARWVALWNGESYFTYRFGVPSLQGLFSAPLLAGNAMACAALIVLAHAIVHGWKPRHVLLLGGASFGAVFSGRRTAILGGVAGAVLLGARSRPRSTWLQVTLILPAVVAASWSAIEEAASSAIRDYVEQGATTARSIMHADMINVATSHFPFGAGLGRFGSYFAGVEYSPEYSSRGYEYIWGLSTHTGNSTFLTDTQWPVVIGEGGFVGAVLAVVGLLVMFVSLWRAIGSDDLAVRWLGLSGVGMFVVLAVASVGLPVFFGGSPPQTLLFAAVGVIASRVAAKSSVVEFPLRRSVDRRARSVHPG